ncbi:MAG: hypothetical protein NTV93_07320 [Verrucomicrobia bacterium]|nr:hypothetical protein [Verrucomicrobiota bacterium]
MVSLLYPKSGLMCLSRRLLVTMNLPEGYLLQVLEEQFGPHIGASLMALLSVVGRNMVG